MKKLGAECSGRLGVELKFSSFGIFFFLFLFFLCVCVPSQSNCRCKCSEAGETQSFGPPSHKPVPVDVISRGTRATGGSGHRVFSKLGLPHPHSEESDDTLYLVVSEG